MAKLKTVKNGELYLMKDGSAHRLHTGTTAIAADYTGYVSSGTWNVMYAASDLYRRTGNHFLSHDYDTSSTVVLNLTHPIVRPVFHVVGSTVHMWYGYDGTGGSGYLLYYVNSTDGGATWGTPAVAAALGTGGTWNDVSIVPVGVHYVDSNTTYLFVAGNDGSTVTIGRYTIDTSGGTLSSEYALAVNYTQYGSNPITGAISTTASIIHDGTTYHMWHGPTATATAVYYNKSKDGLTWPNVLTSEVALRAGANGTLDDAGIRVGGAFYHEGWFYLLYRGYDGTSYYGMAALSRNPNRLIKCGNIETLSASDLLARPGFAADLTFTVPDQHVHISDRERPGVLADASFAPMDLSFTFKQTAMTTTDLVLNRIFAVNPSVREGSGFAQMKNSFNLLYRLDSDAEGTKDDFYLFLDCHPLTTQISEQEDGTTVTATVRCYGANRPLIGRY